MAVVRGEYAVHLQGDDGTVVSFLPGDEVPEWAAKRITNPNVLDQPDSGADENAGAPPHKGPGSGVKAWVAYAEAHEVTLPEDPTKDDVISACEAAGVPVD